jgi:uncharacterized protein
MISVGLLSDTHSHMDNGIIEALKGCELIIHAGDIGDFKVIRSLEKIAEVRAVYGNIDDHLIRREYPEDHLFKLEESTVLMTHIGGYPGKYAPRIRTVLTSQKPDIFICGHSHILKVMQDKTFGLLHMNPGACGHHGFHTIRTILRWEHYGKKIENLRVIELGRRGHLHTSDL